MKRYFYSYYWVSETQEGRGNGMVDLDDYVKDMNDVDKMKKDAIRGYHKEYPGPLPDVIIMDFQLITV